MTPAGAVHGGDGRLLLLITILSLLRSLFKKKNRSPDTQSTISGRNIERLCRYIIHFRSDLIFQDGIDI